MHLDQRVSAFCKLGEKLRSLTPLEIHELASSANVKNGWFTESSVDSAFKGLGSMLEEDKLEHWVAKYNFDSEVPKIVGIIMAGNIPMVGFHDLLTVLMTGHFAAIKPSSDDQVLMQTLIDWIVEIEPKFKKSISIRDRLTEIDAVIATGSDNSSRYFEYYFRKIPKIIRKNRTSVAVLSGKETEEELTAFGKDIFTYFGLGCRNISKVYTPKGFDLKSIFPALEPFEEVIHHHKYRNNYDYYKSIYLVNKTPHLDTGFLLVTSTEELVSPVSNLFHQVYHNIEDLKQILDAEKDKIQCTAGVGRIPLGTTQQPDLWDYADNVDTMDFLLALK
ncbi:MAG: acyl-CoA reductase [Bacteroidota bacterium]